jgi:hypothetical protein
LTIFTQPTINYSGSLIFTHYDRLTLTQSDSLNFNQSESLTFTQSDSLIFTGLQSNFPQSKLSNNNRLALEHPGKAVAAEYLSDSGNIAVNLKSKPQLFLGSRVTESMQIKRILMLCSINMDAVTQSLLAYILSVQ